MRYSGRWFSAMGLIGAILLLLFAFTVYSVGWEWAIWIWGFSILCTFVIQAAVSMLIDEEFRK